MREEKKKSSVVAITQTCDCDSDVGLRLGRLNRLSVIARKRIAYEYYAKITVMDEIPPLCLSYNNIF